MPARLQYVAILSHDDEEEMIVLGLVDTVAAAQALCVQYAKQNYDLVPPMKPHNWSRCEHSRLTGEFWNWGYVNSSNEKYQYWVRPVVVSQ